MQRYEGSPVRGTGLDRSLEPSEAKGSKSPFDPLRTSSQETARLQEHDASSKTSLINLRIRDEDHWVPGEDTYEAYSARRDWLDEWNGNNRSEKIDHMDYSRLFGTKEREGCAAIGDLINMTVLSSKIPGIKYEDIPPYEEGSRRIFPPGESRALYLKCVSKEKIIAFAEEWNKTHDKSQSLSEIDALAFQSGRESSINGWFNLDAHQPRYASDRVNKFDREPRHR